MPTYQYACTECGHEFEQFQSFSDAALTVCPVCGGRLRKVYGSVGVVFKGSGFYRTDSRNGDGKVPATSSSTDGAAAKSTDKSGGKSSEKSSSGDAAGSSASTSGSTGSAGSSSSSSSTGSSGSTGSAGSSGSGSSTGSSTT